MFSDLVPVATVLAEIQARTALLDIAVLVMGATARDVVVRHMTGTPPVRSTRGLDCGYTSTTALCCSATISILCWPAQN
jgi:hypothetical protein